jgi:PAS domain S-box-containing protein
MRRPGSGSLFTLTGAVETPGPDLKLIVHWYQYARNVHASTGDRIRVLHVDDDTEILDLTRTFLERSSDRLTVVRETTAADGLDRLETDVIDCVLSDYDMPRMDGLAFLDRVRAEYGDLPFVLYTGKGSEEIASEAISAGVTDYLQKRSGTDHYEVLANEIETAVARHRAEEELRTTKAQYKRLVEQDVVGIYVIQDGEFRFVNEKLASMHGYDQETLVGTSPLELVAESDRERVRRNLRERLAGDREEHNYRITGKHRDGSTLDLEIHGGRIEYDGRPAVLGVLLNWSERDGEA